MIDLEKKGIYKKGKRKGQERIALGISDEISFSKYGNLEDVWLSRSAFDDFKKCKRCFYLIRRKGFIPPGCPQFTINSTTDKLFFESQLIHTKVKANYLEKDIEEMISVFNSKDVPESNKLCKNCAYARQRSKIDKL